MKGTMQISRLKSKAAYYYEKSFDERYGGDFYIFIEPLRGNDDDYFYYVKKLGNGKIEITGEGYIISDISRLMSYKCRAKKELSCNIPAYYWIDDQGDTTTKTYL